MNLSLVLHRKQWELSEFSVTKEELDLAEKHPQWFIKTVWLPDWLTDFYITKNLKI